MAETVTLYCDEDGCDWSVTGPEHGPGSAAMRRGGHRRWTHGIAGSGQKATRPKPVRHETVADVVTAITDDGAGEAYAETKPTEPKAAKENGKGLLGKLWGRGEEKSDTPASPAPRTTERKPAAPKRRVSTADFWGDLVGPVSAISARAGYVPMARAMEWSSPVVGEIVEDATKGTLADRAVQPFVRNSEKWQDLFDLFGFWGAIGLAQRNPAQAPAALDFARKRFVNLLPRIAANIKKERAKEKAAADALIELMPDIRELFPEMADTDDPVGLLISSLFAAPEGFVAEPVGV